METDLEYHLNVRKWRRHKTILNFITKDTIEVTGKILSSNANTITVVDTDFHSHFFDISNIKSIGVSDV